MNILKISMIIITVMNIMFFINNYFISKGYNQDKLLYKLINYFNLFVILIDCLLVILVISAKLITFFKINDLAIQIIISMLTTYFISMTLLMRLNISDGKFSIDFGQFKVVKISGFIGIGLIIFIFILVQIR